MPADLSMLGSPVEVTAIGRELKKLWAADQTRTRATLFNFAILCEGTDAMRENTELLARFVGNHAFRAILIGVEATQGETQVNAWINANCYLPKAGAKHVCSEQVSIYVKGDSRALLPNLLFQQLDYDLPLTLWWRGTKMSQSEIWRWVDRLVYDSQEWKSPNENLSIIRQEAAKQRTILCDLAWTRTLRLRQALAQMFDTADHAAALRNLEGVTIQHAPGARTTACLLLGWLAAQLHWVPQPKNAGAITFRYAERSIACQFQEQDGASVSTVTLKASNLEVTASRNAGANFLHVSVKEADGRIIEHLMPADCDDLAEVINQELSSWGRHGVYEKALTVAAELF